LERRVPQERGFGKFRDSPALGQLQQALTQIDAAIQAITLLAPSALADEDIQRYLQFKYERPLDALELFAYHATALRIAKTLLSSREKQ
jgi:hypothetical protein